MINKNKYEYNCVTSTCSVLRVKKMLLQEPAQAGFSVPAHVRPKLFDLKMLCVHGCNVFCFHYMEVMQWENNKYR